MMNQYWNRPLSEQDKKLYSKESKCNSCGMKCNPVYIKPVLCEECATKIYEESP